MTKRLLFIAAMMAAALQMDAKVRLHHLIGNNMVLRLWSSGKISKALRWQVPTGYSIPNRRMVASEYVSDALQR